MITKTGKELEEPLTQAIVNANQKALSKLNEEQSEVLKKTASGTNPLIMVPDTTISTY
jgi:DNA-binding protein YbaB